MDVGTFFRITWMRLRATGAMELGRHGSKTILSGGSPRSRAGRRICPFELCGCHSGARNLPHVQLDGSRCLDTGRRSRERPCTVAPLQHRVAGESTIHLNPWRGSLRRVGGNCPAAKEDNGGRQLGAASRASTGMVTEKMNRRA